MIYRQTIQKHLILKAIDTLCHATADEVYETVSQKMPSISKGTVYRNLNQLVQTGQIARVQIPGGADYFDKTITDHTHARCVKCGRIDDVKASDLNLSNQVNSVNGFQILGYTLLFDGLCPDCRLK